jgi:hypothetical protein
MGLLMGLFMGLSWVVLMGFSWSVHGMICSSVAVHFVLLNHVVGQDTTLLFFARGQHPQEGQNLGIQVG